eukprot:1595125-Karenia_brevis.AAC.1
MLGSLEIRFGSKLRVLGAILAPSWKSWKSFSSKLGVLGAIFAPRWRVWAILASSWGYSLRRPVGPNP